MSYLIDTNVVSEIRKGDKADAQVVAWWSTVAEDELWMSTLVLGEIRKGIERKRRRDPSKARALEQWLDTLATHFENRALAVDTAVAEAWGRLNGLRPLPVVDSLLSETEGDMPDTWASAADLQQSVGYQPSTPVEEGVRRFVDWYRDYYGL